VARLALAAASILAASGTARAQDAPIAAVAAQIASAIVESKETSVIVFDFSGPEGRLTALGQQLASDFSAALQKSAISFQVEDRSLITDAVQQHRYAPESVLNPETTLKFAESLQAKAFVMGQLSTEDDKLSVLVSAYRAPEGTGIKAFRIAWPLTQEMRDLLDKDLTGAASPGDLAGFPEAGKNGYSAASCIQCPRARFSDEEGVLLSGTAVELWVVVREDGSVGDVRVIGARVRKDMKDEVVKTIVDTVKRWKFKPAKGPDGNTAAVRQKVVITTQRYF
jgi:hypothetical protein